MHKNPEEIIRQVDLLKSERANWESHWQELAKYCLPRRAYITRTMTSGSKFDTDIYDSTAVQANLILAAGLHSYMTNPASKWFALRTQDRDMMRFKEVKLWLKDAEDKLYDILNASNFSQQIHEFYIDLGPFGTACMYEEEDIKDIIRFYCRPLNEIYILEDQTGRVVALYRKFSLTAFQAFEKWGANAGTKVDKAIKEKKYNDKLDFIHAIYPRYIRQAGKEDFKNMPYASVYLEVSEKHQISEGGYKEFPFYVSRFYKESGEVWGTSPAMVALPDIKQLNRMTYTIIRGAQKVVDPPVQCSSDGFVLPLRLGPHSVNFRKRSVTNSNEKIEPIITTANIPVGREMQADYRQTIKGHFFADMFLMLMERTKDMTAYEVAERISEKMLILAPALGRLMSELLDPVIERSFNILLRNDVFKDVPGILVKNPKYVIDYTSPLARAQKAAEVKSINNLLAIVAEMANVVPSVLDKIDSDKVVDNLADMWNAPPDIIRDDKEVSEIRQAKAQQAEEERKMKLAEMAASAASKGAQAVKGLQPQEAK